MPPKDGLFVDILAVIICPYDKKIEQTSFKLKRVFLFCFFQAAGCVHEANSESKLELGVRNEAHAAGDRQTWRRSASVVSVHHTRLH